jgi:hypothetical protein
MEQEQELHQKQKDTWFIRKPNSWGWYPISWKGWATVAFYVLGVLLSALKIFRGTTGGWNGVKEFLLAVGALTFFLLYTAYTHSETSSWRWSKGQKINRNEHL